jgi:hypothetical protein
MTQDEIIEMAESCGWDKGNTWDDCMRCSPFNIEDFAKLVAQHEREAWVKVCDEMYYAFQVKRKIENKIDEENT